MKKTIKIIDLFNTEKDNLPKKIKIDDVIYNLFIDDDNLIYYQNEECKYFMFSISCFNELNDEVEILDEEEFEDIKSFGIHYSWDYIDYKNIEELKKYVNKDFQNIFDTLDKLIKNQKKIIEKLNKNNLGE